MALELKQEGLLLEIGGKTFTIYPDHPDCMEKLERFYKDAQEKSKIFAGAKDGIADKTRDVCAFCIESIDDLLGAGAVQSIFGDQPVGMMALLKILTYMNAEAKRFLSESGQQLQQIAGNRAQRRQKAKK